MTTTPPRTAPHDLAGLVRLCHHRWLVPVLGEIGAAGGARFAVLVARLGISPPSLRRTLAAAEAAGLVMPNPGYGHPLRPEYLLTPWGEGVAGPCRDVVAAARSLALLEPVLNKWSLPVLAAVAAGAERYADIARALPDASPRALAKALADLVEADCLRREVLDTRPPRPAYGVGRTAAGLAAATGVLAEAAAPFGA